MRQFSLKELIWACLGVITLIFATVSAAALLGQLSVSRAVHDLGDRVIPVQADVEALRRAFTDQDNALREFILDGDPAALRLYRASGITAQQRIDVLRSSLDDDTQGGRLLDDVAAMAATWRLDSAEPQIALRSDGLVQPGMALGGKLLFDQLRSNLRALGTHTDEMEQREVAHIQGVQRISTIIQAVGAITLIVAVVAVVVLVHRMLTKPVTRLVRDVKEVARGGYDHEIHHAGPREITELSQVVERMRDNLRANAEQLVDSELRDEQARIAADLHDHVIQRVFGLGLGLTSAASRRNPDLEQFIDETDAIIRDLREVIFNLQPPISPNTRPRRLRTAIIDIVESSQTALGFAPALRFEGPVDSADVAPELQAALIAVTREALSNVARHSEASAASVCVEAVDHRICLTVRDNGIGVADDDILGDGRRNISRRASAFRGTASIAAARPGPGTIVYWQVPIGSMRQATSGTGESL